MWRRPNCVGIMRCEVRSPRTHVAPQLVGDQSTRREGLGLSFSGESALARAPAGRFVLTPTRQPSLRKKPSIAAGAGILNLALLNKST
jgi:hypothetical protein